MAAVAQHGCLLSLATAELKADKEVVLTAAAQHGWWYCVSTNDELPYEDRSTTPGATKV